MAGREAELQQLSVPALNQLGSQYGLGRGLNKGKKIREILVAEEQRELAAPRTPEQYRPLIEPVEPGQPQRVMLPLQNPISEIYPTFSDPVSRTQQEMERAPEAAVPTPAVAKNGNGRPVAPAEQAAPTEEAEVAGPKYQMLDFDSRGRLKARKELPLDQAHRLLKGREVVFQKLLECLS